MQRARASAHLIYLDLFIMSYRNLFVSAFLAFGLVRPVSGQNISGHFTVDGLDRNYIIHLPPTYGHFELPVVFVLHGGGGNAAQVQRYMGMDQIADYENFITVYPQGINKQWNDGREFREGISSHDDVHFISDLMDTLALRYKCDTGRFFATGISNGGFFSIYLSWKLSNRLLAVAPVCANIPALLRATFHPAPPVSVLLINGTADPLVPYNGGTVGNRLIGDRGRCIATDSTVAIYLQAAGITAPATVAVIPDTNKKDGCTAKSFTYSSADQQLKVQLVRIENGGHALPGASQYLPRMVIGNVCNDFNGAEMIWNFFKSCPRRSTAD